VELDKRRVEKEFTVSDASLRRYVTSVCLYD